MHFFQRELHPLEMAVRAQYYAEGVDGSLIAHQQMSHQEYESAYDAHTTAEPRSASISRYILSNSSAMIAAFGDEEAIDLVTEERAWTSLCTSEQT